MFVALSDIHPTLYVISPWWNGLDSVLFCPQRTGYTGLSTVWIFYSHAFEKGCLADRCWAARGHFWLLRSFAYFFRFHMSNRTSFLPSLSSIATAPVRELHCIVGLSDHASRGWCHVWKTSEFAFAETETHMLTLSRRTNLTYISTYIIFLQCKIMS